MKKLCGVMLLVGLFLTPMTIGCGGGNGGGVLASPLNFVHVTAPGNISVIDPNSTILNHPLLNGNPNALLLVTQNWNPGGAPVGVYNDHVIGVWYDGTNWLIFNQDIANMPVGCAFNVRIITGLVNAFLWGANPGNITGQWTTITNPLTDGNAGAIVLSSQNWNPGGGVGVLNDSVMGVYYPGAKWAIFNQDLAAIPDGSSYNVSVRTASANQYIHIATLGNTGGNETQLSHPLLDGNPNAIFQVTQNWEPNGIYNDHAWGVYYNGANWAIFNQDLVAMPLDAAFNVSID